MARVSLTERRRAQTRFEIAKVALELFSESGYDDVTADMIAEESGVSLRTFYRYFSGKDEVLSPVVISGTGVFVSSIAERPEDEELLTAVERAWEEIVASPDRDPRKVVALLSGVPPLRARWLADLRAIEEALVPVIQQRARRRLDDTQAGLTAAAIVAALRVTLERSALPGAKEPGVQELGRSLRYLRDGANL
ncbi:MAG: TetR/AcrR family transcriptional regulator [Actinomycetota bacterium]|nr:TetR/AcrR family transcriptional regulator [Actinomycetota bacterium]